MSDEKTTKYRNKVFSRNFFIVDRLVISVNHYKIRRTRVYIRSTKTKCTSTRCARKQSVHVHTILDFH